MITQFNQLQEGEMYSMFCSQFNVTNKVYLITKDHTGLGREIAYFQYADRRKLPMSKEDYIEQIKNDCIPEHTFAMWFSEIEKGYTTLTPLSYTVKESTTH